MHGSWHTTHGAGLRRNAGVAQKLVYLVPLPGEPVPRKREARGGLRPHLQTNLSTKSTFNDVLFVYSQ